MDRVLIAQVVRWAVRYPDRYLAATIAACDLAAAIGGHPGRVWLLRLAGRSRLEHWAPHLDQLAALASADSYLLRAFLQQQGITVD
jgi:hypothetical protein